MSLASSRNSTSTTAPKQLCSPTRADSSNPERPRRTSSSFATSPLDTQRVRSIHYWLTHLFVAGVAVQIFLAGYGVFASAEGATEHKFVDNFAAHAAVGWLLGLLGFILLGLALGAGLPAAVRKLNGLLFLLLVLQFVFAGIGPSVALIGGLHALNAVVILLV